MISFLSEIKVILLHWKIWIQTPCSIGDDWENLAFADNPSWCHSGNTKNNPHKYTSYSFWFSNKKNINGPFIFLFSETPVSSIVNFAFTSIKKMIASSWKILHLTLRKKKETILVLVTDK